MNGELSASYDNCTFLWDKTNNSLPWDPQFSLDCSMGTWSDHRAQVNPLGKPLPLPLLFSRHLSPPMFMLCFNRLPQISVSPLDTRRRPCHVTTF